MAVADLVAADAVLKSVYLEPPHNLIIDESPTLSMIKSGSKDVNVKTNKAEFLVTIARNQGTGARLEREDLPRGGTEKDVRASLKLTYQYHAIDATGQTISLVKGNPEAFVDYVKRSMDRSITDFGRDLNRQIYGDATGTLATLTGAASTTTLTVDDAHWLEIGMLVDVLTAATLGNTTPTAANGATSLEVVNIADDNVTVTVSASVTAASGSVLVRSSDGINNWKKEWIGLQNIVSQTSTLHGINPSTVPAWKAGYVGTSAGTVTEAKIWKLVDGVRRRGGVVKNFLTTYGVGAAYWNTLQGLRQFNGNDQMKGGIQTPVYQSPRGNIGFTMDDMAPTGTLYGLDPSQLFLHEARKMAWDDTTGSVWNRVGRKEEFEAWMVYYANLGAFERRSFGKLTGLTEIS